MISVIWQAIDRFGNTCYYALRTFRQPVTRPICRLLIALRINQSHISVTRLIVLVGFLPLWINQYYWAAILLLATYFFLDFIDGDLARMLKRDSDLGKFEDSMSDNFMVVVLPLALIWQGLVLGALGAYYIFISSISWWLSVIRRNRRVISDWLFRPEASGFLHFSRFWVVTILIILYAFWRIDVFNATMVVLSIILTASSAYDYYQITKERWHNRRE